MENYKSKEVNSKFVKWPKNKGKLTIIFYVEPTQFTMQLSEDE